MDIAIDRQSAVPIYQQIVRRIREMILSGTLPVGFRLPPERRLAEALGVNRSTILTAYRELKADCLVDAHVGRGTTVLHPPAPQAETGSGRDFPWRQLFRSGTGQSRDPVIRDLLALTERRDVISLSVGLPAPELLPLQDFREILNALVDEVDAALLLHCPTEGHSPLRETLSRWVASRGICCSPREVLVLSGSQQGLDLAARIFLDPGETVFVEEPTYCGALPVFRAAQARVVSVPTDENGMRTDLLAALLQRHHPKLIYTLPTFQNPSGIVMSPERRRELLDLAFHFKVPILEDDPYGELRYEGEAVPSLKAMDDHGIVMYLSTFSKALFPGLRLGWLVAPPPVVRQFTLVKQAVDLHTNTAGQWILDRYMREGLYEPHLRVLREAYKARRDTMEEALREHAPEGLDWQTPFGGFYFWCALPEGLDSASLLAGAAQEGVSYLPGRSCFAEEPERDFIRLNFSYPNPSHIRKGVALLSKAVGDLSRTARAATWQETATPPIV